MVGLQQLLPCGLGAEPPCSGIEEPRLEEPNDCCDSGLGVLHAGALQSEAPSLSQMRWDRLALLLQLLTVQVQESIHFGRPAHIATAGILAEPRYSAKKRRVIAG